ncbi:MAG: phosphoribosylformylglycinamidine synthase [Bacteroidetes bacterium]|nr:phosphoribosylformylglycinamidine synthase [Bacteroidota bacterium]
MVLFFKSHPRFYAVEALTALEEKDISKLLWLFGEAKNIPMNVIIGDFIGPRREMITPWSTNAVEICQNMGIKGISRIEEFVEAGDEHTGFDPMLQHKYNELTQEIFHIEKQPEPIRFIEDIAGYNSTEGLALNNEEIQYLEALCEKLGRKLTDSEVFGFSQVNSEHCRHKIFNGVFIIDGLEMPETLFGLIKKTSIVHPNLLVSAYKDNVAFISGPSIEQFAPVSQNKPDFFIIRDISSVISLKAETHNFPTTVEPFNGAATGSGGEIRDRMAGGKGSIPLAGTAVYMTSYPRLDNGRTWEKSISPRKWLYKTPEEILIKASNGASDFGNKFGQPLIVGSVLTFEQNECGKQYGFDKVIMLAGGVGFAKKEDSLKDIPGKGDRIIVLGGDNYRIGMGGGAVSSVATGEYKNAIELNAVQRSNPEMQKRIFNAIRALTESTNNPIVSIHDHGAGGHLNSISELVEETGGEVNIDRLPLGDPTLSLKEIISNESQERMGLLMKEKDVPLLEEIAQRERAPLYQVGHTTGDHQLTFREEKSGLNPIDLSIGDFFGKPPKTIMKDSTDGTCFSNPDYDPERIWHYLDAVLQLESVACKDWLTNKVDRAVSGKIAKQQTCGPMQLPLNNLGVVAFDYQGLTGVATSLGHAPVAALADPVAGSRLSIAEALTNLIWAPLTHGLKGVSLSANWMWPCRNNGEDARLYEAVKAVSDFAIELGINIPTGKDSLSMTQKYPDGSVVFSPGTVIISATGEVSDIKKVVSPVVLNDPESSFICLNFSEDAYKLGGSSFAQVLNKIGNEIPTVKDTAYFVNAFNTVQDLINGDFILAGHDISAGGMITTLLEMTFSQPGTGLNVDLTGLNEKDLVKLLFSENPGIIIQVRDVEEVKLRLTKAHMAYVIIGSINYDRLLNIKHEASHYSLQIDILRDTWVRTSYLLDRKQCGEELALQRYTNYKRQPLLFRFKESFTGKAAQYGIAMNRRTTSGIRAAIIREKGVNRDRDMAWALYLAGFDVRDVHMTDLISGRETLEDIHLIAFVGGFSNSDVLGSAKGWAGAFLYNEKAKKTLERFFYRNDTLSIGVCNGCQLLVELGLIYPEHQKQAKMAWNDSHKFESSFLTLDICENHSVMLGSLSGTRLGIWVAHGEGKFTFPYDENKYHIAAKFSHHEYPGNPNGSFFDAACIASIDGRHLAIMPHLEDSILPWQWAYYPEERRNDEVTPWIEAFVNAREWIWKRL